MDKLIPALALIAAVGLFPVVVKIAVRAARTRYTAYQQSKPRCDMDVCDNPQHRRVHAQRGTGRLYVPMNHVIDSVLRRTAREKEPRSPRDLGIYE